MSIKYRSYKNNDYDNFIKDLENASWDFLHDVTSVDYALDKWYEIFLVVVDKHAPLKEK